MRPYVGVDGPLQKHEKQEELLQVGDIGCQVKPETGKRQNRWPRNRATKELCRGQVERWYDKATGSDLGPQFKKHCDQAQ